MNLNNDKAQDEEDIREDELAEIDAALELPAVMAPGERLARILSKIEGAREAEGDALNRAEKAEAALKRITHLTISAPGTTSKEAIMSEAPYGSVEYALLFLEDAARLTIIDEGLGTKELRKQMKIIRSALASPVHAPLLSAQDDDSEK